jgi:hypothetical protein
MLPILGLLSEPPIVAQLEKIAQSGHPGSNPVSVPKYFTVVIYFVFLQARVFVNVIIG